ncbi:hypothetical protein LCGC14_0571080 [marine sediment metagenome]|uniref:Uncharacterized protein n=1 Tax=marine sediment metagenome TaxID=412755 RepID=A0A0F9RJ49_9ZZZZ
MNAWKVTAIISIILNLLQVVFWVSIVFYGLGDIEKENQCAYNVCDGSGYESYIYYDFTGVCECYNNGELMKTRYLE